MPDGQDKTQKLMTIDPADTKPKRQPADPQRARALPEGELTEDQKKIRELEDQLAKALGRRDTELRYEEPPEGERILIHILHDGFTAFGQVWFRGQELEVVVGSVQYEQTKNRRGETWLSMRDDPAAQYQLYGREMFRGGPWPGSDHLAALGKFRTGVDDKGRPLPQPTREELEAANAAERARGRRVPTEVIGA
jgi:hypothetical protein